MDGISSTRPQAIKEVPSSTNAEPRPVPTLDGHGGESLRVGFRGGVVHENPPIGKDPEASDSSGLEGLRRVCNGGARRPRVRGLSDSDPPKPRQRPVGIPIRRGGRGMAPSPARSRIPASSTPFSFPGALEPRAARPAPVALRVLQAVLRAPSPGA